MMQCAGFSLELYDLYSLGVLDAEQAAEIGDHLKSACSTCQAHFNRSLERVSLLAFAVPQVLPPRSLRGRIVGGVRPSPSGLRAWFGAPVAGWAAAGFCIVAGTSIGAYLGSRSITPQQPVVVTRLSAPSAEPTPALQVRPPQEVTPAKLSVVELSRALSSTQSEASVLSRDLAQQRIRVTALEADARTRDTQLAAAEAERARLQSQILADSENAGTGLQELRTQLVANRQQTEELRQQVRFYQTAIQSQRVDLNRNEHLVSLLSSPSLRIVNLQSTEQGGSAVGRALLSNNGQLVFYASKLPSLPAGRTYQLWLMRDRGRAVSSGGVFQPDGNQTAIVNVPNAAGLSAVTALAVTEEPAGGQPLPTGHKILIGTAKS